MRNMMNEYLGNDYSDNHLKNFCLYWMKGRETEPDYEQMYNDLLVKYNALLEKYGETE